MASTARDDDARHLYRQGLGLPTGDGYIAGIRKECADHCLARAVNMLTEATAEARVHALLTGRLPQLPACNKHRRAITSAIVRNGQNCALKIWRQRNALARSEPILAYGLTGRCVLYRAVTAAGRSSRQLQ